MKNKLGFHIARPDNKILELAESLQPKVIKVLDFSPDFLWQLRLVCPGTTFIGRFTLDTGTQDNMLNDPAASARGFATAIMSQEINRQKFPIIWEGLNEVFSEQAPIEKQIAYDVWMCEFYNAMNEYGLTPMALNFATGNFPNPDSPEQFLDTFANTLSKYTHFGFHEYDWPTMDRLHQQGLKSGNDGMWLALRYRRMWDLVGQKDKKFWITETGMTQGVQGLEDVGWLADPKIKREQYLNSLTWYNSEIVKDGYVQGACIFTTVSGPGWDTFETIDQLEGIWKKINPSSD